MRTMILLLLALCLLPSPAHAAAPAVSGDIRLVLDVAQGEPDAARRDEILRYGARYAKSAADAKALVAALSPAAQKALSAWPEKCPSCKGTGKDALGKPCFQCHGAGMTGPMRIWQENPFQCGMCRGTGELFPGKVCPACHGAGVPGPMKGLKPAVFDRTLERILKVRVATANAPRDKRILDEMLRLREENRR